MAGPWTMSFEREGGVLVGVLAAPSIGDREAEAIYARIESVGPEESWRVVLDLSAVSHLGSAGVGMLVRLHNACRRGGGHMAVCGLSEQLLELLQMTRMDRLLLVGEDRATAAERVV